MEDIQNFYKVHIIFDINNKDVKIVSIDDSVERGTFVLEFDNV